MMKKNLKNKNGITLIALVVTIVVLLILAGVSISMLTGENGIITQARKSKTQTEIAEALEQAKLDVMAWRAEELAKGNTGALDDATVKSIIKGKDYAGTLGESSFTTKNGYEITYSELYTYTGKWAEPYEIEGFTHIEGEWNTGYVIQDDVTRSEFVWIPVGCTINGVKIDLERVFYDDNLLTDEWTQMSNNKTLEAFLSAFKVSTKEEYWNLDSEVADYIEDFVASVEENKGFYIGRYEASYLDGKVATKVSTDVSRTSDTDELTNGMLWNYINQPDAITKCKEMYTGHESGINSKLVNSYAWDTALKFINAVEGKNVDTNSNDWGNYNSEALANTGTTSKAIACNIYDIAGNLVEWTTEIRTTTSYTYTLMRGGFFSVDGAENPAGFRDFWNGSSTMNLIGFRPILYK